MAIFIKILKLCCLLCLPLSLFAQPQNYKKFTITDGLPSNYIYRAIEDNNGYLWIATDAGVARYDGKSFQIFTTDHGLPDNEVLNIAKEVNGRIWVNCFKQKPAYFDEVRNRFVNSKENTILEEIIEGTAAMHFFPIKTGGMMFVNEKSTSIIKEVKGKLQISFIHDNKVFIKKDQSDISYLQGFEAFSSKLKHNNIYLYSEKNGKLLDSILLVPYKFYEKVDRGINNGNLYYFMYEQNKFYKFSEISSSPLSYKVDSVSINEPFNNFQITNTSVSLLSNSGKIHLFKKENLEPLGVIQGDFLPNSIFDDKNGNYWVSTIDKGLLLFRNSPIKSVILPNQLTNRHFLSINKPNDFLLFAGNFMGEIIKRVGNNISINRIPKKSTIARIRKIIYKNQSVYSFSEEGAFKNYTVPILYSMNNKILFSKTGELLNDSIIIVGHTSALYKLNLNNLITSTLNGDRKRVTAIAKINDSILYFGSTDGLYKYNYIQDKTKAINKSNPVVNERITGISFSKEKLAWISTGGSGVAILRNDSLMETINESKGLISNATRCISTGKPGQIWVGTSNGISIIHFSFNNNKLNYKISNITINDGLSSNTINELTWYKDSMYAATSDGISIIPTNISIPKRDIPVLLQEIAINQRDTIITNRYQLEDHQKNIQLKFASVDLTGHSHHFEYKLDKAKYWSSLYENTIALELNHGIHVLEIRSVDINGYKSKLTTKLIFDIKVPVWKTIWFWLLMAIGIQSIAVIVLYRIQVKKKRKKIAEEYAKLKTISLELQSFTSLMNPHFIFNALNSIQHYINLQDRKAANRYLSDFASLIRKNFDAVQQYFIPLDLEMENIKIYLRLEQMRFNERLSYSIKIDETLDLEHIQIPTMILQPILENAILHGIMPSKISGMIEVELYEENNHVIILIKDNGIGFKNSEANKTDSSHVSKGLSLIYKRIEALNELTQHPIKMTQYPNTDDIDNPGNTTKLEIPFDTHTRWTEKTKFINR